jgi:hypothetical protein
MSLTPINPTVHSQAGGLGVTQRQQTSESSSHGSNTQVSSSPTTESHESSGNSERTSSVSGVGGVTSTRNTQGQQGGQGSELGGGGGGQHQQEPNSSLVARGDLHNSVLNQNTFNISNQTLSDNDNSRSVLSSIGRGVTAATSGFKYDTQLQNSADIRGHAFTGTSTLNTLGSLANGSANAIIGVGKELGNQHLSHIAGHASAITGPAGLVFGAVDTVLAALDLGGSALLKYDAMKHREQNGGTTLTALKDRSDLINEILRDPTVTLSGQDRTTLTNQLGNIDRQIGRIEDRRASIGSLQSESRALNNSLSQLNAITEGGGTLTDTQQAKKERIETRLGDIGEAIQGKERVQGLQDRRSALLEQRGTFYNPFSAANKAINAEVASIDKQLRREQIVDVEGGNAGKVAASIEDNQNLGRKTMSFLKAAAAFTLGVLAVTALAAFAATGVGAIVLGAVGIGLGIAGGVMAYQKRAEEKARKGEITALETGNGGTINGQHVDSLKNINDQLTALSTAPASPEKTAQTERLEQQKRLVLDRLIDLSPQYAKRAIINDLQSDNQAVRLAATVVARDVLGLSEDSILKIKNGKKEDGSGGVGNNAQAFSDSLAALERSIRR